LGIQSHFDADGSLAPSPSEAMLLVMGDTVSSDAKGRIRVLLGEVPNVVAEVVRRALIDADIEVLTLSQTLPSNRNGSVADVVILPGERSAIPPLCQELLQAGERTKILTLMTDAEQADLYELRLVGSNVGLEGVVAAVRAVAHGVH